jgi:O-antigen ligase
MDIKQSKASIISRILNDEILGATLLLSIFFLPINLFLNNLLFTIFFAAFFFRILTTNNKELLNILKINWVSVLVLCGPLLIALLGSFYTSNLDGALKDLGRLFPLALTIPLIFYNPVFFSKILKKIMVALSLGCLVSASICWGVSIVEIYNQHGEIDDLFSQQYAYHKLSERVNMHTPYLGIFVAASVFYLFQQVFITISKKQKLLLASWALVLFTFLLNLLARTAIITLIMGVIILLVYKRKYIVLFASLGLITSLGTIAYYQDHNFLRDRIFRSINILEERTIFSKKDDRFSRYEASVDVFKKYPIIGPGTAGEDVYRKELYFKNRDSEAYNENYNAHNQFLEYISTFGLLGGVTFLMIVFFLVKEGIKSRDVFTLFLVFSFLVAGFTESILERSWGISFYVMVIIFIYGNKMRLNEIS